MDKYRVSLSLTNDLDAPAKQTFANWQGAAQFALDTLDQINGANQFDDCGARDVLRQAKIRDAERLGVFPLYDPEGAVRYVLTVAAVVPDDDLPKIDAELAAQLVKVREDGSVNMLNIGGVQVVADRLECYALVVFISDVLALPKRDRSVAWMNALRAFPDFTAV